MRLRSRQLPLEPPLPLVRPSQQQRLTRSSSALRVPWKAGKWMPSSSMLPARGATTPRYSDSAPSLRTILRRLRERAAGAGRSQAAEGGVDSKAARRQSCKACCL